jgi:hypothetical protein
MTEYLLGLATIPATLLLSWIVYLLTHRAAEDDISCAHCARFHVYPQETGAPWWWYKIRWAIHERTPRHKERRAAGKGPFDR